MLAWADKFQTHGGDPLSHQRPIILRMIDHSRLLRFIIALIKQLIYPLVRVVTYISAIVSRPSPVKMKPQNTMTDLWFSWATYLILFIIAGYFLRHHMPWILLNYDGQRILHVIQLGGFTLARITVFTAITACIWIPIGVWIGLRPKLAYRSMPIINF